jgi:hypothetical protein
MGVLAVEPLSGIFSWVWTAATIGRAINSESVPWFEEKEDFSYFHVHFLTTTFYHHFGQKTL